MAVVKVTSKGQITIPIEARKQLGIDQDTYLDVDIEGDSLRFRKHRKIRPLSDEDPIWDLIGTVSEGPGDVAENHDKYLAEGEIKSWRSS